MEKNQPNELPMSASEYMRSLQSDTRRIGPYMMTSTGRKLYPQDLRPDDFCIDDIANGLASVRRYGGQADISKHYSVAEHCGLLADYAFDNPPNPYMQPIVKATVALAVLLHDASEAFLGDLPSPVKHGMKDYQDLEATFQNVILAKYKVWGTSLSNAKYIHDIDHRMLANEVVHVWPQTLLDSGVVSWHRSIEPLPDVKPACFSAQEARWFFLSRFVRFVSASGIKLEKGV